jgi:hypothetical protein
MAEVARLSKATISRIWRTFGLQSHRVDTFKLSADPQFVEKVRAIVRLVPESARLCPRALRRREEPRPGPGAMAPVAGCN